MCIRDRYQRRVHGLERSPESNQKIQIKRNKNLFQMMSKFIGTRDVTQCRSHHQKFFNKALAKLGINQGQCNFSVTKKPETNCDADAKTVKKVLIKDRPSIFSIPEIQLPPAEQLLTMNPIKQKIEKSK
eukprot:TRINITY_DN2956_c0_g2_i2.p2 TRINITY_DN2956_c0_g2~~TRINITY_DN2956_c0_g2_i2.p2  ORF type:complete len:129 (-),score=23.90 TRINITY_DN2956_c0_g2_i2:308-694(-)